MGTLLFNRVLNGVLNGISTSTCSIPKRFDSHPISLLLQCNATQCMYENGRVILSNGNQLRIVFWFPKIIKYETHPSSKALIQIILFVSCIPLSFHRMVGEIS